MASPPKPILTPVISPIGPLPKPIIAPTPITPGPITPIIPIIPTPTTPTGGSTVPTISLTTANPTYPATTSDQNQAAEVIVAWDPSFANLQSLTFGLTVTDDLGSTSTQKTVTVTIQQAPVANLTTPNNIVSAGSNITLDGTQSTGVGLTYQWNLTNTTSNTTPNPPSNLTTGTT
jgi:spore germination protein YaaH